MCIYIVIFDYIFEFRMFIQICDEVIAVIAFGAIYQNTGHLLYYLIF